MSRPNSSEPGCRRARRFGLAALLLAALASLVACRRSPPQPSAALPQRVVSQVVLADEILWALGPEVRSRVVGVSSMADDGRYSNVAHVWPAATARVPGTAEALVAAAPDLVLVAEFTANETRAMLEQLQIRTETLAGFGGFADYRNHVGSVAKLVGAAAMGEALVAEFDRKLAELRARYGTGPRPAVISWNEGTVAGAGTIFADELDAAGFTDLAAAHGVTGHRSVAVEDLVAWNPRYIVISCGELPCDQAEAQFAQRPGIAATQAGNAGGIIAIEPRWLYSTGADMLRVVEALGERKVAGR